VARGSASKSHISGAKEGTSLRDVGASAASNAAGAALEDLEASKGRRIAVALREFEAEMLLRTASKVQRI
jgi:hypothetical protein